MLHGRCNILLAMNSLCLIPLLAGTTLKFFVIIFGLNSIRLDTCYGFFLLGLIGAGLATSSQLCIGIDRLICVLFSFWYKDNKKSMLSVFLFAFCYIHSFYLNCFYFYAINLRPEKQVTCGGGGDFAQPEIGPFIYLEGLVLFCAEFLCYALIWVVILCRNSQAEIKNAKKLMKSLTVIMCITFFCYIQGNVWRVILPYVHFSQINVEYFVTMPTSILYMMAFSSNTPVLYTFSSEYRSAFRKVFPATFRPTWAQSAVQVMPIAGSQPQTNQQHT